MQARAGCRDAATIGRLSAVNRAMACGLSRASRSAAVSQAHHSCRQREHRSGEYHGQRQAPGPNGRGADQPGHRLAEHDQDEDLEPVGQVRRG